MALRIVEILDSMLQITQETVAVQQAIDNIASQQLFLGNGF